MAVIDITNLAGNFMAIVVDEDPTIVTVEEANAGDLIYYQANELSPATIYAVSAFGVVKIVNRNNYEATNSPDENDDETKGYDKGSEWIYNNRFFKCVNPAAGNAEWLEIEAEDADGDVVSGTLINTGVVFDESNVFSGISTKIDDRYDVINEYDFTGKPEGVYILEYKVKYKGVTRRVGGYMDAIQVVSYTEETGLMRGEHEYIASLNTGGITAPSLLLAESEDVLRLFIDYPIDDRFEYKLQLMIASKFV